DSFLNHPQIWAALRNMSLPPIITTFGSSSIAADQAVIPLIVIQQTTYFFDVAATDPENDAIKYNAMWLEPWMSWNSNLHRLAVVPGGTAGKTYNALIQVPTGSGGTDRLIASFYVCPSGGCSGPGFGASARHGENADSPLRFVPGPNPSVARFWVQTSGASR